MIKSLESKNLIGRKWGELTEDEQKKLLSVANVWDNVTEGDCIVDMDEDLAIAGTVIKYQYEDCYELELKIDDEAIFYNPIA